MQIVLLCLPSFVLRFGVLTAVTMEITVFWDMMPYSLVFLCQQVNTATSSPADDVHHYIIPQQLLLTSRFYFQQTSGIHVPVGKRKGCSSSSRSPGPIADSFHFSNGKETKRVKFARN
jgi:hypothetical protein